MYILNKAKTCSCGVVYSSVGEQDAKFATNQPEKYAGLFFFTCAMCKSTMVAKGGSYNWVDVGSSHDLG